MGGYFLHRLGLFAFDRWSAWICMGAVLFVRGSNVVGRCQWRLAHLVGVLLTGRFVGVGQFGRRVLLPGLGVGFVVWIGLLRLISLGGRGLATHSYGLYFPLLRLRHYNGWQ